jgi:Tetracyclin repressor-like, C-terminal domain
VARADDAAVGFDVDALRAHPSTAVLLATRNVASAGSLRTTEAALDILRRAGFSPAEATRVARHALSLVTNLVGGVPGMVSREEPGKLLDARRRAGIPGVAATRGLPAAGGGRGALERAGRPGRPLRLGTRSAPRRHRGDGGAQTVKPRSFAEQREHTFHRSIVSHQTSKSLRG